MKQILVYTAGFIKVCGATMFTIHAVRSHVGLTPLAELTATSRSFITGILNYYFFPCGCCLCHSCRSEIMRYNIKLNLLYTV